MENSNTQKLFEASPYTLHFLAAPVDRWTPIKERKSKHHNAKMTKYRKKHLKKP
jgi:hypothetical protein